jgi:hypothetical protein
MSAKRNAASRPKWQPPDALGPGARVRVVAGQHVGKSGRVIRAYRGRPCGPDRIYVELDGGPIGWSVSLKVEELEAVR